MDAGIGKKPGGHEALVVAASTYATGSSTHIESLEVSAGADDISFARNQGNATEERNKERIHDGPTSTKEGGTSANTVGSANTKHSINKGENATSKSATPRTFSTPDRTAEVVVHRIHRPLPSVPGLGQLGKPRGIVHVTTESLNKRAGPSRPSGSIAEPPPLNATSGVNATAPAVSSNSPNSTPSSSRIGSDRCVRCIVANLSECKVKPTGRACETCNTKKVSCSLVGRSGSLVGVKKERKGKENEKDVKKDRDKVVKGKGKVKARGMEGDADDHDSRSEGSDDSGPISSSSRRANNSTTPSMSSKKEVSKPELIFKPRDFRTVTRVGPPIGAKKAKLTSRATAVTGSPERVDRDNGPPKIFGRSSLQDNKASLGIRRTNDGAFNRSEPILSTATGNRNPYRNVAAAVGPAHNPVRETLVSSYRRRREAVVHSDDTDANREAPGPEMSAGTSARSAMTQRATENMVASSTTNRRLAHGQKRARVVDEHSNDCDTDANRPHGAAGHCTTPTPPKRPRLAGSEPAQALITRTDAIQAPQPQPQMQKPKWQSTSIPTPTPSSESEPPTRNSHEHHPHPAVPSTPSRVGSTSVQPELTTIPALRTHITTLESHITQRELEITRRKAEIEQMLTELDAQREEVWEMKREVAECGLKMVRMEREGRGRKA